MNFVDSPEEAAWREEVRAFVDRYVRAGLPAVATARVREGEAGPHSDLERAYHAELGARGWTALSWPSADGDEGGRAVRGAILSFELEYAGLPQLDWTASSLAPIVARFGTEANKRDWLPKMRSGEVVFALGYSEADAGTDLANLSTRAVLDGDEWVVDGEKMWNSGAHFATHEWLAVRTDPAAGKHGGISVLIVPIDSPGIEIYPFWTWAGTRTNRVTFTGVRVPAGNLVGELNAGWTYITGALSYERAVVGARSAGRVRRLLDDLRRHCRQTVLDGQRLIERPDVRYRLAQLEVEVEVVCLMTNDVVSAVVRGELPATAGAMQKVAATELATKLATVGLEVMDLYGQLNWADEDAPLGGDFEQQYRHAPVKRFAGGASEVMRDAIAQRGLGLPRQPR